jgi:DNA invertase Pin-like site-specific DNA recombinase
MYVTNIDPLIAIITRASRDREDRRISTDRQEERCKALAADRFPGVPTRVYCDNNVSGADPDAERDGLDAFMVDLRAGLVAEVVTHEQSRITRIPEVWERITVALSKAGIDKVHTVQAGIITVGEGNRLVGRLLAIVDAEEVERTRARTLAAHQQLAIEGRPSGGRTYGYRSVEGSDQRAALVIEPEEAKVIRLISDRLIEGYSLRAICTELNDAAVPTPRGGARWIPRTVRTIVTKPTIAGLRGHTPTGTLNPAKWDYILTEERWRQTVRALGSKTVMDAAGRRHHAPRAHRSGGRRWLLTGGLARCGLCHQRLVVVQTGAGMVASYSCHRTAGPDNCCGVSLSPASVVEDYVVGQVLDAIEDPKVAARLKTDLDPKRKALLVELADARALMDEAAELRGAGVYDKSLWEKQFFPANARAEAARSALVALPDFDVELPPADQIAERWKEMPLRQRRALLERFVEVVEVMPAAKLGRPTQTPWERVDERVEMTWRR